MEDAPEKLNDIGRATWYKVYQFLLQKKRIKPVHFKQLERYCVWCEVHADCMEKITSGGIVSTYNNDNEGVSAWMKAAKMATDQMQSFEKSFGLTPSSDAGLPQNEPVQVKPAVDGIMRFKKENYFQDRRQ